MMELTQLLSHPHFHSLSWEISVWGKNSITTKIDEHQVSMCKTSICGAEYSWTYVTAASDESEIRIMETIIFPGSPPKKKTLGMISYNSNYSTSVRLSIEERLVLTGSRWCHNIKHCLILLLSNTDDRRITRTK